MELVCNELSFYPLANTGHIAEERFRAILLTFESAKEKYDFTHIRFPKSYSTQQITATQTLYQWITTLTNHTLKTLILTLFRPPYTDDLEEAEMARFFKSNYTITGDEAPVKISPIGLPVAHIKAVPCISFSSHDFWRNRKIQVRKTNGCTSEDAIFNVYNICLSTDLETQEINEWVENSLSEFINSSELLVKYLGYSKYSSVFSSDFLKQLFEWKNIDIDAFKYILLLMKDVELHPFTGGRGQTENLKNRGKEASKRINNSYPDGDRLSYTIEKNIVTFLACKGHYGFH